MSLDAGTYFIRNAWSNAVLDLSGGWNVHGTPLTNWIEHHRANQKWIFEAIGGDHFYIKNQATGTYLSLAPGVAPAPGAIVLGTQHPTSWHAAIRGNHRVFRLADNHDLVLDLFDKTKEYGSEIGLSLDNHKTGSQQWGLEPAHHKHHWPHRYEVHRAYTHDTLSRAGSRDVLGSEIAYWAANGEDPLKAILKEGKFRYRSDDIKTGVYLPFLYDVEAKENVNGEKADWRFVTKAKL